MIHHRHLAFFSLLLLLLSYPVGARQENRRENRPDTRQENRRESRPDDERPEKSENNDDAAAPKLKTRDLQADVVLCDGRTHKGRVSMDLPDTFLFTHTADGLEFVKKVRIADIKSIEFERWTPTEQGKGKDGRIFRFDVNRYRVELADSTLVVQKPLPPYLHRIKFSNRNGDTFLYAFWMDLLKGDNSWFTGIQGPPSGERAFCHKDVVKKITFTK